MENIENKIDTIIKKQEQIENKLNALLQNMYNNDNRANTGIFIQGLFLADLLSSWGNLNGNNTKGR